MIRWEQQENGDWQGFSGELPVAAVAKDPDAERERWAWKLKGLKRPKGWRSPSGIARHGSRLGAPRMRIGRSGCTASPTRHQRLAIQSLPRGAPQSTAQECAAGGVIGLLHSINKRPASAFSP